MFENFLLQFILQMYDILASSMLLSIAYIVLLQFQIPFKGRNWEMQMLKRKIRI